MSASPERIEFEKKRSRLLSRTETRKFICARCGIASKSVNLHHINPLIMTNSNDTSNLIPLCGACHREWDYYEMLGMQFGTFLVTLPINTWAILTATGILKKPSKIGAVLADAYKLQFSSNAIKYNNTDEEGRLDYYEELKRQNEAFSAYKYSDLSYMLDTYGDIYASCDTENEFNNAVAEKCKNMIKCEA